MSIKWYPPESCKHIHSVKFQAPWVFVKDKEKSDQIDEIFKLHMLKSNSNAIQKTTNENVKVSGGTRAVIITGAESGKNIKVYTSSGV